MKKFTNKLLLSDMDGTLLNSQGIISKENQEAVKYFIENGGLFGIATGRSQLNSVLFLDEIKVNAPCILYNGCGVYDFAANQFISLNELSKERLKVFLEYCLKEFSEVAIQIYCPELCYFVSPESLADPNLVSIHQPCEFCKIDAIADLPWIKILLSGEAEELKALNAAMIEFDLEKELSWVFSSESYLEYLPYGVSKGSALLYLKERMNSGCKVYAVGDYNNDVEMLQAADVGIATENAISSLKERADIITVSNDDNAIADIIYNIL
jgi:Cof subfamily protein (haloacid dehalogenase superfamily)